jgi:uncharacterized protein YraI
MSPRASRRSLAVAGLAAGLLVLSAAAMPAAADYVTGLDPYGDNFLSLRTGPGGGYPEIMRMGENTILEVLETAGPWYHVRLRDGTMGWAHSRWIHPGYPP